MTARVLVVDDVAANVKLLEARLVAEYFDVFTAYSGEEALEKVEECRPDIILLDVMMPGIDGFETCRRIKANSDYSHIPIVMVTALDGAHDRIAGFEAGADDFLTKPINKLALIMRVKNLTRVKALVDEYRQRATTVEMLSEAQSEDIKVSSEGAQLLFIGQNQNLLNTLSSKLHEAGHDIVIESDASECLTHLSAHQHYETILIHQEEAGFDALRLSAQIRSSDFARNIPIIMLTETADEESLLKAFELGVSDYISLPIENSELLLRLRSNIRKKRYLDMLKNNVNSTLEMAFHDPMTNLYNRRYFESHLTNLITQAQNQGRELSLIMCDIDYFKSVNDSFGHDVGDIIIQYFAKTLLDCIREFDLACRFGGEEFIIILPDTEFKVACFVAERIRRTVASFPIYTQSEPEMIGITASFGVATLDENHQDMASFIKAVDEALYKAKQSGRNKVAA